MKNLLTLLVGLTTFGLQAQISTFDLDQSTLVYINYMPGEPGYDYDYNNAYEFVDQANDLLEFGVILPVWKKLNANIGLGATFNFQEPELWSDSYDYVSATMGKGPHLKTGLSYSLAIADLKILPNVGVVWNTEAYYYSEFAGTGDLYEITSGDTYLWGVFDAGVDVVYKNILIGLTLTDVGAYYYNYAGFGIKLGYAFKQKAKMNF
jgi:hypothetical protein